MEYNTPRRIAMQENTPNTLLDFLFSLTVPLEVFRISFLCPFLMDDCKIMERGENLKLGNVFFGKCFDWRLIGIDGHWSMISLAFDFPKSKKKIIIFFFLYSFILSFGKGVDSPFILLISL